MEKPNDRPSYLLQFPDAPRGIDESPVRRSTLWESFAPIGSGHNALLRVAENSLRRSVWSKKSFRSASAEEQDQDVFRIAEILARRLAEDYRRADELGLDLAAVAARNERSRRKKKRQASRLAAIHAIQQLSWAEEGMAEHREGYEEYERLTEHHPNPPLFSPEFAQQQDHRWYRDAERTALWARGVLGLDERNRKL